MKKAIKYIVFASLLISGCRKFVEPGSPETQLDAVAVFRSDATAHAAQLGIYRSMETEALAYRVLSAAGLSADELSNFSSSWSSVDMATNNLTTDNPAVLQLWTNFYRYIYQANAVLEGVASSSTLGKSSSEQLIGEAKFVRAFCYLYLAQFFGEVPLVSATNYLINSTIARSPLTTVFDFIEADLVDAVDLLPENYTNATGAPSTERVRPNKVAAKALLARLYLIQGRWSEVEAVTSEILSQSGRYGLEANLDDVFLKNSSEAIWQWMSIVARYNSSVGANTVLLTTPTSVALDTAFLNSFRHGDKRRQNWVSSITVAGKTYYFPFKYKVGQNAPTITEYTMAIRLAEIYLNRAEARAMLDQLILAHEDINVIRERAGLAHLAGLPKEELIDSIHTERRYELFSEFGDRWFDLNRTGKAEGTLTALKGANWNSTDRLYPIPQQERDRNPNISQNDGY